MKNYHHIPVGHEHSYEIRKPHLACTRLQQQWQQNISSKRDVDDNNKREAQREESI
jgi:hypothetical protein